MTAPAPLTARQTDVLRAICTHMRQHGVPPTVREIRDTLSLSSPNGVMCHVRALAKKGWLTFGGETEKARSIRVLAAPDGFVVLPNHSILTESELTGVLLSAQEEIGRRRARALLQGDTDARLQGRPGTGIGADGGGGNVDGPGDGTGVVDGRCGDVAG